MLRGVAPRTKAALQQAITAALDRVTPNEVPLDSTQVKARRSASGGKGGNGAKRIERLFRRLKDWRRIATRNDRLANNRLAGLALAAVVVAWS